MGSSLGNARSVTVFAPGSVGNVAVGFDVIGHALVGVGDRVTVERHDAPQVRVVEVTGAVTELPDDHRNTAVRAIQAMVEALGLESGFDISIEKGIPLGSGMGGSAASAAAAVLAVNQMLKIPLQPAEIFTFALAGESAASGDAHGDNVGPSLMGGLTLTGPARNPRVIQIPVPNQLRCVLVHPELRVDTGPSRQSLPAQFDRHRSVGQLANLAAFMAGCYTKNLDLIEDALEDLLVEPFRAPGIPGFEAVKAAALDSGAMGCSLSGSGPSMFAWFRSEPVARAGAEAMVQAFADAGLAATSLVSQVNAPGARVV